LQKKSSAMDDRTTKQLLRVFDSLEDLRLLAEKQKVKSKVATFLIPP
jgi:hypothetical protein